MPFLDMVNLISGTLWRTWLGKIRVSFLYSESWKGNIKFYFMFMGKRKGEFEKRSWKNKNEVKGHWIQAQEYHQGEDKTWGSMQMIWTLKFELTKLESILTCFHISRERKHLLNERSSDCLVRRLFLSVTSANVIH